MQTHETAHQWWGDLIGWKTYRDQWISEAVANYSALMLLEETRPADTRFLLDTYRNDLDRKTRDDRPYREAGPVTLGFRLNTSVFPDAYIVVTYGRGTWLMHMLRTMFADRTAPPALRDARYIAALRSLRETYARKEIGTEEFRKAFEARMPESLQYQGQHSLAWFFDGWVAGSAVPKLELKDVKINPKGAPGTATFTILQEDCPDDLVTLVPIFTVDASGARAYAGRVFADGHESKESLKVPPGTKRLLLDADQTILRRNN
jgi:aminopeptidase N